MASTIDFSAMTDKELLFGYQRVNRSRFPDNFMACTQEAYRRGLSLPEKFEVEALGTDFSLDVLETLGHGLASMSSFFTKRLTNA